MKFGVGIRRKLSGADLYVRIMQVCAILALPFIFLSTSYQIVLVQRNIWAFLFDTGMSGLPRLEELGLSALYRMTGSEVIFFFVMMAIALAFGMIGNRLFRGDYETALKSRKIFLVLIIIDLVIRLIPMRFSIVMGLVPNVIGFVIRLVCLALVYMDLRADKAVKKEAAK